MVRSIQNDPVSKKGYLSVKRLFVAAQRWRWMSGWWIKAINKSGHEKALEQTMELYSKQEPPKQISEYLVAYLK